MTWLERRQVQFIITFSLFCMVRADQLRELHLQGFLPMTGTGWPIGGACLPATLMAVRHVNERAGLLDGYNVTYTWADSKCHAGEATFQMFKSLSQPPTKHMLLGCACSVASVPTAQVSHLFNVTQISYGSTSPALSNRTRFPNFYQLDIPDHAINPAKIALMREFNWKRVATINQAIEYHSLVIDDFVRSVADTDDIQIISQELFQDDPFRRIENLKEHDARIIIMQMYGDKARMCLCAIYKLGLYGPKIILILNNWYSTDFWLPRNEVPCTEEEMQQAIEGAFLMGSFTTNPRTERGIAGLTVSEFDKLYRQEDSYDAIHDKYYICAAFSYDCVWIAALALNCTETYLRFIGHPKHLNEFTYQDSDINDIILSCMNNISFTGVSGRNSYSGGAAPVNKNIKIERIQNSEPVMVGTYIMDEDVRRFEWIKDALKWKDNKIPRDSTYVKYEEILIPRWLYVLMTSCTGIGLLIVIGFFVFSLIFRHNRIVKLSSPNINNVLLLGCFLIYAAVFMSTSIAESDVLCKTKTFLFTIGFSVAVGSHFFKTWRVYSIFIYKKEAGYFGWKKIRSQKTRSLQRSVTGVQQEALITAEKSVKDSQVICHVFGFAAGITLLLTIWEIVSPQVLQKKELLQEVHIDSDDVEVRPFVSVCYSENGLYFSWTIYIVEGTMLLLGAFLAWETRNVKMETFNDSQQIGLCLYNTMVLSAFGLTISLLLENNTVVVYAVTSACIIFGTSLNLAIVFVPKVIACHQSLTRIQPVEDTPRGEDRDIPFESTTANAVPRKVKREQNPNISMEKRGSLWTQC